MFLKCLHVYKNYLFCDGLFSLFPIIVWLVYTHVHVWAYYKGKFSATNIFMANVARMCACTFMVCQRQPPSHSVVTCNLESWNPQVKLSHGKSLLQGVNAAFITVDKEFGQKEQFS